MKTVIAAILLLAASTASYADVGASSDIPASFIQSSYTHLQDMTSNPGEAKNAFLGRVGKVLREFADKTGLEACSVIAKNDSNLYSVVIGTNKSHLACVNDPRKVLPGYVSIGETIHTHGKGSYTFLMNPNDMVFTHADHRMSVRGEDVNHFSALDFDAPGYLATPNGLVYQSGKPGTEQPVTE